jgi:hypothetical protein
MHIVVAGAGAFGGWSPMVRKIGFSQIGKLAIAKIA